MYELPARTPPDDDPARRDEWLIEAVPRDRRRVYKMRPILESLVDRDSLFEMGRHYGPSVITAFARLDGWPVAIVASDPFVLGGLWTAAASAKLVRFIDLAQTFHLPVVHLMDNPGFIVGSRAEREATIRYGVRALAAVYQATVPWCTVVIRKAFGVAGAGHGNHTRFRYRYAWPSADWGSLPIEGGIQAAYKAELAVAADPEALLASITADLDAVRSPFRTAEQFLVEDIIDPRDTRPLLCEFANLAAPLLEVGPSTFGPGDLGWWGLERPLGQRGRVDPRRRRVHRAFDESLPMGVAPQLTRQRTKRVGRVRPPPVRVTCGRAPP